MAYDPFAAAYQEKFGVNGVNDPNRAPVAPAPAPVAPAPVAPVNTGFTAMTPQQIQQQNNSAASGQTFGQVNNVSLPAPAPVLNAPSVSNMPANPTFEQRYGVSSDQVNQASAPTNANWQAGTPMSTKMQLTNLIQTKPPSQWSPQEKNIWASSTVNSPLPEQVAQGVNGQLDPTVYPTAPVAPTPPTNGNVTDQTIKENTNPIATPETGTSTANTDADTSATTQADTYSKALENYLKTLSPSDQEIALQKSLNNELTSKELGLLNISDQTIPMDFITGQSASLEKRALQRSAPLQRQLALEQAQRQAGQDVAKTMLTEARADKTAEAAVAAKKQDQEFQAQQAQAQRDFTSGQTTSTQQFQAQQNAMTTDTKEYNLSKEQGYSGSFTDYLKYKEDLKNQQSVSSQTADYKLWTELGQPEGDFASWYAKKQGSKLDDAQLKQVDVLTSAYNNNPVVKDYGAIQSQKYYFDKLLERAKTGAVDMASIYQFMKLLDPTSVVRETEFESAANNTGPALKGKWAFWSGKFDKGQILSEDSTKNIISEVNALVKSRYVPYQNIRNQYATQINGRTGDTNGDSFLINYDAIPEMQKTQDQTADYKKTVNDYYAKSDDATKKQIEDMINNNYSDESISNYYKLSGFNNVGGDTESATNALSYTTGTTAGNCAEFVNKVTADSGNKLIVGFGLSDKKENVDKFGTVGTSGLSIGDVIVTDENKSYGHVAIVTGFNKNGDPIVSESNYDGNNKVTHGRPVPINRIYGYMDPLVASGKTKSKYT